ncbi:MAG: hypothetical protein DYG92_14195 [Leptolyngbya sp. PLA1]|nr:hypothetical protein [Leptolyngbya sp. PLA1]
MKESREPDRGVADTFRSPRVFVRGDLVRPGMVLTMLGTTDELSEAIARTQWRPWAEGSYVSHAGMFVERLPGGHWTFFEADDAGTGTAIPPSCLTFECGGTQQWTVFPDAAAGYVYEHPGLAARVEADPAGTGAQLKKLTDEYHEVYSHYVRLAGAAGVYGPMARGVLSRKQRERDEAEGALSPRGHEGVFCSEAVTLVLEGMNCPAFEGEVSAATVGPGDFAVSELVAVEGAVRVETAERMGLTPARWAECEKLRRAEREGGLALLNKQVRANKVLEERVKAMEAVAREHSEMMARFRAEMARFREKLGG